MALYHQPNVSFVIIATFEYVDFVLAMTFATGVNPDIDNDFALPVKCELCTNCDIRPRYESRFK